MKDMEAHLEKLRRDAAECAIIRDLATDPKKRELFTKLAEHMSVLASEVERAISKRPIRPPQLEASFICRPLASDHVLRD